MNDADRIRAAEEKRKRKAAKGFKDSAYWPKHGPTASPGKSFSAAPERRLHNRARKM